MHEDYDDVEDYETDDCVEAYDNARIARLRRVTWIVIAAGVGLILGWCW